MTVEQAIAEVRSKARGRTRYEGQVPFLDELLVGEIDRLREINADLLTLLRRVLSVGLDEGAGYLKQERLADDLTQEIRAAVAKAKS